MTDSNGGGPPPQGDWNAVHDPHSGQQWYPQNDQQWSPHAGSPSNATYPTDVPPPQPSGQDYVDPQSPQPPPQQYPQQPGYLAQPMPYPGHPYEHRPYLPPKKDRKRVWRAIGISAAIVVVGVAGVVGYLAWLDSAKDDYAAAEADLTSAREEVQSANDDRDAAVLDAQNQLAQAQSITTTPADGLVDPNLVTTLADETATLSTDIDAVLPATELPAEQDRDEPSTPWELQGQAQVLRDEADEIRSSSGSFVDSLNTLSTQASAVDDAASQLFASVAPYADDLLTTYVSAKNDDKIAFDSAAMDLADYTSVDADAVDAYSAYVTGATNLVTSYNAEMAEKAGPLLDSRLAIEEFARSLAPGIWLDFDWTDTLNGATLNNNRVAGYTTWWWGQNKATIQLSNSNAMWWGGADDAVVRALVAHEVGHAISVRCQDKYDSSSQDLIEEWATAWAISMGYNGNGNGVSEYGEPRQEIIDAAATCR